MVAATSVGIVDGRVLLDLNYEEDSQAEVDMNVVMTSEGGLVETQATAERQTFSRAQLDEMLDVAERGYGSCLQRSRRAWRLRSRCFELGCWAQGGRLAACSFSYKAWSFPCGFGRTCR